MSERAKFEAWDGLAVSPRRMVGVEFDFRVFPWRVRLWAVLTIPYQLMRFVVTGHFTFLDYKVRR